MKLHKSYLSKAINNEVLNVICTHYDELHARLICDRITIRSSQTEEDLLQIAIIQVSQDETELSDKYLIDKVIVKFFKLLKGLKLEEPARREVITDRDVLYKYGKDMETEEGEE